MSTLLLQINIFPCKSFRSVAVKTANGDKHLMRSQSNFVGPTNRTIQQQNRSTNKKGVNVNNSKTEVNNKPKFVSPSKTFNTNSTTLATFTEEPPQQVSCRSNNSNNDAADDARNMDKSNSSSCCVTKTTFVCKPQNSQVTELTSSSPQPNKTYSRVNHITPSPELGVNLNSETLAFNQTSINSGTNTSYYTSVVKSKSEW